MKVILIVNLFLIMIFITACSESRPKDKSVDQKPTITLNGNELIEVEVNNEITDPMANAVDEEDGSLEVVSDFNEVVNFHKIGEYTVTYQASDKSNQTTSTTRTIKVVDKSEPTISFENKIIYVEVGTAIDKVEAIMNDNYDALGDLNLSDNWNEIDFYTTGHYTVTYQATDTSGNEATESIEVVVRDTTKPVIQLNGAKEMNILQNESIVDLGAVASDNYDENIIVSSDFFDVVNTGKVGTYQVTYQAADSSGNQSTKIRTIHVLDVSCQNTENGNFKVSIIKENNDRSYCGGFSTFNDAKTYINQYSGNGYVEYNNKIVYAKDALMRLVKSPSATTSLTYLHTNPDNAAINTSRDAFSYFSSEYKGYSITSDAIYLDTYEKHGLFAYQILINGVIGWISAFDAKIILPDLVNGVSYYQSDGENLFHAISTSVLENQFSSPYAIDKAPAFMNTNKKYYSFDGHYFYEDWQDIAKDIREETHARAVNQIPYFNYYQYLPYHSITNYTALELNDYIDYLTANYPSSVLRGQGQQFINFQDTFALNAALELSMANHESGIGTSALAIDKNNLFGMNATDSNPYGNGTYFDSIENCIFYHGEYYLLHGYISPFDSFRYNGSVVGNKYQGMNVKYASDIYWGEKIAGHYYRLDRYLGFKDYGYYQIGFSNQRVTVYGNDLNTELYEAVGTSGHESYMYYPFIILDEGDNYYKIQTDAIIDDRGLIDIDGNYDFNDSVGYILKSQIDIYQ